MKKYIILFIVLNIYFSYGQNGKITYKVTTANPEDRHVKLKKQDEEISLMSFSLFYDNEKSFYKKNRNVPLDEYNSKIASIFVSGNIKHYQLYSSKESIYISNVKEKKYQVVDTTKRSGWKLSSETKKIDNFICYKATIIKFDERNQSSRTITAWYTPEIPVPYGPIGYGGLPGLILQLDFINGYVFSPDNIILNKKKIKVPDLPKIEKISRKQYHLLRRKARKVTED